MPAALPSGHVTQLTQWRLTHWQRGGDLSGECSAGPEDSGAKPCRPLQRAALLRSGSSCKWALAETGCLARD